MCTAEIGISSTSIIEADEMSPPRAATPRASICIIVETTSTGYITDSANLVNPNIFSSLGPIFTGDTLAKISFPRSNPSTASAAEIKIKTALPIATIIHNSPKIQLGQRKQQPRQLLQ